MSQINKNWRGQLTSNLKFDDEAKAIYIDFLSRFGRKNQAARAAGVAPYTAREHANPECSYYDPAFAEAVQNALEDYRDRVREKIYELAVEGVEEEIFGGRFKDTVVGKKKVYSTHLLALEAKRVDPAYRDKGTDVNVQVNTGVMVTQPQAKSEEDWEEKHGRSQNNGQLTEPPGREGDNAAGNGNSGAGP